LGAVASRLLPVLLVLTALVLDVGGSHGAALVFVLLAIPASFALALDCYGDSLEARCGGGRPILAGLSVALLVLSAAVRSPAVVGGTPQFAISALVLVLFLYAAVAVGALMPERRTAVVAQRAEEARATRRRAA
jgi:hypothetical protein